MAFFMMKQHQKMLEGIKNIIFDYGNVIFEIDFPRAQKAFEKLGIKNVESFFAHKGHSSLFDQFETGTISAAEFRGGIRKAADNDALSDQQIDDAWNALLIGVMDGNHELLLKLKKKYRTFLLSNINEIHLARVHQHLKEKFDLEGNEGFFEKIYYSHLVGKRKPSPEIFRQVLDENNLKAEETLFIDDSPQHLKPAAAMGIRTYLLTYPDSIRKVFEELL